MHGFFGKSGLLDDEVLPVCAAHLLLLEAAEVAHRTVFTQRSRGVLVVADLGEAAESPLEGNQTPKLAHLLRQDRSQQIQQLVHHKVDHRQVP